MWPFKKKRFKERQYNPQVLQDSITLLDQELNRNLPKYDGMDICKLINLMPESELKKYPHKIWFGLELFHRGQIAVLVRANHKLWRALNEKNF